MAKRSAPANWVASKPDHARCRQAKTPGPTKWGRCCAVSNCAARLNLRSSAAALKTLLDASRLCPTRKRPVRGVRKIWGITAVNMCKAPERQGWNPPRW